MMFGTFGTTELLIVLAVAPLLFGVGRIGKIGHELGIGIRAFREGLRPAGDMTDSQEEPEL
jgi:sec-independent protein translocase protein TatA